jgi:hypothetical protein
MAHTQRKRENVYRKKEYNETELWLLSTMSIPSVLAASTEVSTGKVYVLASVAVTSDQ